MSDEQIVTELLGVSLDAMKTTGPRPLLVRMDMEAQLNGHQIESAEASLPAALQAPSGNSALAARLRTQLSLWDAEGVSEWAQGTAPKTADRRSRVYEQLGLPGTLQDRLTVLFPVATDGGGVVISTKFEAWYAESLKDRPSFYWDHYSEYLRGKGWDPDNVANLGLATGRVVERLADPQRETAYRAKGLVVGYVQSGKTANFTGVMAKAIDAGYRLIIVLTGTTDLLRAQTQRRIDKELVGRENLLRGVDAGDVHALQGVNYWGEPDWDTFVSHGELPSILGHPDIYRLTTRDFDYKALLQGIEALDFQRFDMSRPLNAPENLRHVPARVAIVKKNATVLKRLVKDLRRLTALPEDIPALVIDDESDQASPNTSNPAKWEQGLKQRSAINAHLSDLLELLPRGQYIGYTATPFANVFVDADDSRDIFPSSFVVSLDRPPGYMGASDFHDLEEPLDDPTVATSNELAFVRDVRDDEERDQLREALDAFVLAGAIKLFREDAGSDVDTRHHTMLLHESIKQVDHRELAEEVRSLWSQGAWYTAKGSKRLEELYERDYRIVMEARAGDEPVPETFDDIKKWIGTAAERIAGSAIDPVWIVNGDKEVAEHDIDFDARSIWKVFVGGAKLSRGFTIEGLTVSYYVRVTTQADTLMQMGRWFGFRPGYRDLVRLYIGRASDGAPVRKRDIYEAFEAACRSEEMFRDEIRKYGELIDGKPQLTPADVPPLVTQHLRWLRPAAANKMYNARLIERRTPGARLEPAGYPSDASSIAANALAFRPVIESATQAVSLNMSQTRPFDAFYGVVDHQALIHVFEALAWMPQDHFAADLTWLRGLTSDQIEEWVIVLPQLAGADSTRDLFGLARSVHGRSRREGRALFSGIADPKHRLAVDRLASNVDAGNDEQAGALQKDRRGAVLIYPVFELKDDQKLPVHIDARHLIMGFVIASPKSTGSPDQPLVQFGAWDPTQPRDAVIER
jgi:hypothetical protein